MRSLTEIEAELKSLGRPQFDWSTAPRLAASKAAIAAWEAEHPVCADRYRALAEERDAADAAALAAYRSRRDVPSLPAADVSLETEALRGVRSWLEGDTLWCLVVGSIGQGKTVAARWAVGQVLATGRKARLERATDVARLSTWDDAGMLDDIERCSLLALDDLGTEGTSEHARTTIRALLDARHEARRRTVITSNLVNGALSSWVGDRISDRIRSSHTRVQVSGKSLRGAR